MENTITVGIIRSIFFDKYYALWNSFFNELGVNILISEESDEDLLNSGIKDSIYESCLAVKLYIGHINYLKDKVDYILIPRIKSTRKNKTCLCFYELHDIVVNTLNTNILSYDIKLGDDLSLEDAFVKMGLDLGFGKENSKRAYHIAKREAYKKHKIDYLLQERKLNKDSKKILLVGYSYYTNDNFILNNLKDTLYKEDIDIIYSNITNPNQMIDNEMYFYENNELFNNILDYKTLVDGIIFVTTYPCESSFELITYFKYSKMLKNIPIYIYELNKSNQNLSEFIYSVKGDIYE